MTTLLICLINLNMTKVTPSDPWLPQAFTLKKTGKASHDTQYFWLAQKKTTRRLQEPFYLALSPGNRWLNQWKNDNLHIPEFFASMAWWVLYWFGMVCQQNDTYFTVISVFPLCVGSVASLKRHKNMAHLFGQFQHFWTNLHGVCYSSYSYFYSYLVKIVFLLIVARTQRIEPWLCLRRLLSYVCVRSDIFLFYWCNVLAGFV